jgi:hypothetical protein
MRGDYSPIFFDAIDSYSIQNPHRILFWGLLILAGSADPSTAQAIIPEFAWATLFLFNDSRYSEPK